MSEAKYKRITIRDIPIITHIFKLHREYISFH